ncbi:MAG: hypothetical protein HYZ42_11255, partial [Bacteroidetes bacterium]|nr:hypothetical protein [Bacteroidota bacterium]
MYFFTELSKLKGQDDPGSTTVPYGPVLSDPTHKYVISANMQLSGVAKAFACQDALLIVVPQEGNANLVNVILRPITGLDIEFQPVQYYVYRGLLLSSFVLNGEVTPSNATTNSELIKNFWTNWTNYKTETSYTGQDPKPREAFGYDTIVNLADNILIENIFNNTTATARAIKVSEGEWIGDFYYDANEKISFEIITGSNHNFDIDSNNPDYLRMDLKYFRQTKHVVDVSNINPVSGTLTAEQEAFKMKVRREEILSYIDPAAFFGMYYHHGILERYLDSSGTIQKRKKKKQDLYNDIVAKFKTKNTVYLDIRSEYGYSYNFYENYQISVNSISGVVLKIKTDSMTDFYNHTYDQIKWPIIGGPMLPNNKSECVVELQFRVGNENPNPILYLETPSLINKSNKKKFITWDNLPKTAPYPDWTDSLVLKFPNVAGTGANIATYIKLQYFRQNNYVGAYPTKVLKTVNNLDTAFGSLHLPSIDG